MGSSGIGAFFGNAADSFSSGLSLAERVRKQKEEAILRQAQEAVGRSYGGGAPPPGQNMGGHLAPPMPGGPPNLGGLAPQARPPMPQPPMPGQASVPGGGAGPPGVGPGGGGPMPAQPPMPQPQPRPDPNAPPAGGPGGPAMGPVGGAPLSGQAAPSGQQNLMGSVVDANNTIKAIAQSIKASNPGIEPRTLFLATQETIEQMKGVRSEVKDYMYAQIELAKMQERHQVEQEKMAARMQELIQKLAEQQKAAETRAGAQRDVATIQGKAREKAAEIAGSSRVAAAGEGARARIKTAEIGAGSREKVADIGARARGASDTTKGRTARDVARINMGKDPATTPPVPGAKKANDGNWYVQKGKQFFRVDPGG